MLQVCSRLRGLAIVTVLAFGASLLVHVAMLSPTSMDSQLSMVPYNQSYSALDSVQGEDREPAHDNSGWYC